MLVGVDGSDGSRHALLWALDKEERFGPVRPVVALGDRFGAFARRKRGRSEEARNRWGRYVESIRAGLEEVTTVIEAAAGPGLVEASRSGSLLVVGSRGRSTVEEVFLGSVASYCAAHSQVPVAIVPLQAPTRGPLSVMVVGVDGSVNSEAALGWALENVDPDGKVIALGGPSAVVYRPDPSDPSVDPVEGLTRRQVEDTVARVQGQYGSIPTVEIAVTTGDIRAELREAAQAADLLVLGSRGHRGVRRVLHGSIAVSMTHHPTATTVVVPL